MKAARRPLENEDKKITKKIGRLLVQARKEKKITQVELAERLNLTQAMICTYEQGSIRIPITQFIKIAKAIGISPGKLLDGDGISENNNNKRLSRRFLKRLEEIEKLPEFEQRTVVKMLDGVIFQHNAGQKRRKNQNKLTEEMVK